MTYPTGESPQHNPYSSGPYAGGAQTPSSYSVPPGPYSNAPQGNYGGQQPPYGQPGGYPGGYGGPRGPKPSRTGAVVTLVLGILVMIGGPVIGFAVMMNSIGSIVDSAVDGQSITNDSTVTLDANTSYGVYLGSSADAADTLDCTITGPSGANLPTSQASIEIFGTAVDYPGVEFTTQESGEHLISCTANVPVNSLTVSSPIDFDGLLSGTVWLLAGLAIGFVGFVVMIVGIILLVRANRRIREAGY